MAGTDHSKPTLKDVARLAGCSTATVSTVINSAKGNTLVSDEMRRQVRAAAEKLGYRPNFASRSLIRRSTRTIGVYVPPARWSGLGMRYEASVVQGVERACRTHDYDVLAINLGGGARPDLCLEKFAEQRIDGLILLHVGGSAPWLEPLLAQSRNIVAVNYYGTANLSRVNFDDEAAGVCAAGHLLGLGHRRIAFVGSHQEALGPGAILRCQGYRAAMAAAGLPVEARWIWDRGVEGGTPLSSAPGQQDADAAVDYLLGLGAAAPTALVAYNDLIAIRLLRRVQQRGLTAPRDVSVIGIDDIELGEMILPALTTVRQPCAEMGELATERLIAQAGASPPGAGKAWTARGAPELVVRESTAAPHAM